MSLPRSDDLKKALTDPRRVIEECGYTGPLISEGSGLKIACPWHGDSGRPNLSVRIGPDGTIQAHCFSCQKGGSVFDLIMGLRGITDFKEVIKEAARIAGVVPTSAAAALTRAPRDTYPDPESVRRFWGQTVDLLGDSVLCDQLRARGIPPEMVRELARALPEVYWNPRWEWVRAEPKPLRWRAAGYRLVLPLYDTQGKLVSVHARRFGFPDDKRKGTNPIGKAHGLVLLNQTAIKQTVWHDAIFVEGAPSFLVVASLYSERPVIGVLAGSCKGIELPRIPRGADVTIWTDNELQKRPDGSVGPGAGDKYRQALIAALARRRIRVVTVPIPDGEKKAPAADDIYKVAGLRGVEAALAGAELQSLAADADAQDIWERAAGLVGIPALPGLDMGRLDDREVLRCSGGVLISRAYNEFGEHVANAHTDAHPGWLADELGLRFLQTGEAGPGGVLLTHGFLNFLALAQHFDADDPNAPAVLAGPIPKSSCRLTMWPPRDHPDSDHWVVRASEPAVAAEVGAHAVDNILSAAQFVSIDRPIPPPADKPRQDFPRTDIGNAERLAYYYGEDLRYVYDWKEFLVWDGHRWARDRTFEAQRRATVVTRLMYSGSDADKEWAHKSEGSDKHHSMVSLLREQPGIPILPERLDADAFLLNVRNGTLDLRTGRLLPYDRRNLITKSADVLYDRNAKCPEWLKFLNRIFDSNKNLISYIQRAAGYSMTGDNREEKMFVLFGKGRNGKSTFMLTLQSILGDYSQPMSADLLIAQGDKNKLDAGQLSAIAALRGARFVAASETDEGARLGEKTVKQLVKRDSISAKFMGKDMFDFLPSHKLWLCTNHRLRVSGKDLGFWSAIIEIPFKVTIPDSEIDRTLPARLMAERSGILNWLLDGCLEWQAKKGLQQPAEIDESIKAYRQEMDYIQPFLDECCEAGPYKRVKIAVLRAVYEYWCKQTAKDPMGNKTFARLLEEKFPSKSDGEARFRDGLEIKPAWLELLKMAERG